MSLIRKAHKPRRAKVVRKWTDKSGTTFTLSQRPDGQYEVEALSKDGEDYNCALGNTPKAAIKHLSDDASYPAADRDPLWTRA